MFAKVLLIKCLFLAVFSVSYSRAQSFFSETNFPDSNFRAYLLENFGDLNAEEARSITFLDTPGDRGEQRGVIIDLTGVHLMTGLVTLRASYESVEKVPDLMGLNALRYIDLNANEPLNHVPKIPSGVAYLDLSSTSISDLSPILDSQLLKERDNGLSVNHTLLNNDDCGVIARLNARAQASGGHFSYSNQEFGVLDCSDALPNHRMFPHISNPDAGFTSWITLFSIGQQSADYVLHFLSSEGVIVQEETGELMNGDYVSVCPPDGAAYALVNSQIGITAFMAFKHQESRIATYLAGSSIGKKFTFMVEPDQPGFFTGMSLVNVSDEFGEISITNASTGVSTQITLQPRSKFLSLVDVLVSITSYQTPLIISADIDISVLALRGSIPGGANPILYHIDTEPLDE